MSLDGWSNVHNEPIVCVAATSSTGVTYVTDTIDTSGKPHTSDYLKELAVNTISATESKYGCNCDECYRSYVREITRHQNTNQLGFNELKR